MPHLKNFLFFFQSEKKLKTGGVMHNPTTNNIKNTRYIQWLNTIYQTYYNYHKCTSLSTYCQHANDFICYSLFQPTEILVKLSLYRDCAAYYSPEDACYSLESCARREGGRGMGRLTSQPSASVISDVKSWTVTDSSWLRSLYIKD